MRGCSSRGVSLLYLPLKREGRTAKPSGWGINSRAEQKDNPYPNPPPFRGRECAVHGARDVPYDSIRDAWLRTGLSPRVLERLADADAFSSLGLTRREALWAAKALGRVGDRDDDLPLFAAASPKRNEAVPHSLFTSPLEGEVDQCRLAGVDREGGKLQTPRVLLTPLPNPPPQGGRENSVLVAREDEVHLPPMPLGEEVINDYRFLHLSLRAHPSQFLRADLAARNILRNEALRGLANGTRARISGLVTCRQRPGSANGVVFMTIEDESAVANVIVWPKVFERVRPIVLGARYVAVSGVVQQESGVIHVVADRLEDLTYLLAGLAEHGADIDGLARCDEVRRPIEDQREAQAYGGRHSRLVRLMHEMPELAADLGVHAPGSAHAPNRRAG